MAHFWELGGGKDLAELLDVVVTEQNVHTVVAVIVVDLKEGRNTWASVQNNLVLLQKRINNCFRLLKQRASGGRNQSVPAMMVARMEKRFGEKHPDLGDKGVTIMGVPIVIIGTKYDLFRDEQPAALEIMSQTLRFWAHSHAAALMYMSTKDDRDLARYRQLMLHLIFGVPWTGQCEFDPNKPLLILPGKDSFKDIGRPREIQRPTGFVSSGREEFDKWKAPFEETFPAAKAAKDKAGPHIDTAAAEYAEPAVDTMRAVKDDELEQFRTRRRKALQDAERKAERSRKEAAAGEKEKEG